MSTKFVKTEANASALSASQKRVKNSSKKRYSTTIPFSRLIQEESVDNVDTKTFLTSFHPGLLNEWAGDCMHLGALMLPPAAMLEIAVEGSIRASMSSSRLPFKMPTMVVITDFQIHSQLVIIDARIEAKKLTNLKSTLTYDGLFNIYQVDDVSPRNLIGECKVQNANSLVSDELAQLHQSDCPIEMNVDEMYSKFSSTGLIYGDAFRLIKSAKIDSKKSNIICRISLESKQMIDSYFIPPTVLDAVLQSCLFLQNNAHMPTIFDKMSFYCEHASKLWESDFCTVYCSKEVSRKETSFNFHLLSGDGRVILAIEGAKVFTRSSDQPIELISSWVMDQSNTSIDHLQHSFVADSNNQQSLLIGNNEDDLTSLEYQLQYSGIFASTSASKITSLESFNEISKDVGASSHYGLSIVIIPVKEINEEASLIATVDTHLDIWLNVIIQTCKISSKLLIVLPEDSGKLSLLYNTFQASLSAAIRTTQLDFPKVEIVLLHARGHANIVECEDAYHQLNRIITNELKIWDGELEVLYTGQDRMVQRYNEVLINPTADHQHENIIDDKMNRIHGLYIITGGLGALGLITAKALANLGATQLVLLSRSGKVSNEGQGLADDLHELLEMPKLTVHIIKCDVSDEISVIQMLNDVRALAGDDGIQGIVHSAGVSGEGTSTSRDVTLMNDEIWLSKAHSSWLLHKHSLSDRLKVFLVYSSISAAIGYKGNCVYASANGFLDGLILDRMNSDLPGQSIRWPAIAGVGMAARDSSKSSHQILDESYIQPSFVYEFLESLFSSKCTQHPLITLLPECVIEKITDKAGIAAKKVSKQFSMVYLDIVSNRPVPTLASKDDTVVNTRKWSSEEIFKLVRETSLAVLGESDVSNDAQLMDVGLDSLGVTELSAQLASVFKVNISSTVLFSYPTINELVKHMENVLGLTMQASVDLNDVKPTAVDASAAAGGDMAIVGVSMQFPGGINSLGSLWDALRDKKDMTSKIPLRRWDSDAIIHNNSNLDLKTISRIRYGGCIDADIIESFDANFFGISDAEAMSMDPNQRLLLELNYAALEDAGYTMETLRGKNAGVYVGIGGMSKWDFNLGAKTNNISQFSVYDATKSSCSIAAGRISYSLGLIGPSTAIDTACSSSLVALHLARRSLQMKECDFAVVSAVNFLLPELSIVTALAGMTSPDGKCHTFDQSANGYCRSEGCGAVILKRLNDAIDNGDNIYAIVKGSAVMQDGKSASLTAPNGLAQESLIRRALADAGVQPLDVKHIEAHGTGTPLGDPIETASLAAVFGTDRKLDSPLTVSGVKANIGHLEAAAGMAGLFASLLVLKNSQAPPNCQLKKLNPKVENSVVNTAIVFPREVTDIIRDCGKPLLVGVSSFGFSGTIAHVILQEAPKKANN